MFGGKLLRKLRDEITGKRGKSPVSQFAPPNKHPPLSLSILASPYVVENVEHELRLLKFPGVGQGEFCILEHTEATLLPTLLAVKKVPSSGCITVLFVKVYVGAIESNIFPGFEYSSSSSKSHSPYDSNPISSSSLPPRIFTPGRSSNKPPNVGWANCDHWCKV